MINSTYKSNPSLIIEVKILIKFFLFINANCLFKTGTYTQTGYADEQYYDSSLGVVLNVDNLDRDTGEYKYQRRPLFEWLARWLK